MDLDAYKKRKRDEMSQGPAEPLLIGGYSNESNPFGDSNLSTSFDWKLKKDKMVKQGMSVPVDSKEAERRRAQELQVRCRCLAPLYFWRYRVIIVHDTSCMRDRPYSQTRIKFAERNREVEGAPQGARRGEGTMGE
jgi:hypothetical protein